MTRQLVNLTVLLATACGGDGFVGELREPPDRPATLTSTTTDTTGDVESSTTNDVIGDACAADMPCADGAFCVAPGAVGNVVGVGAYACSATCVEVDDPGRWCLDAASCCDAAATCELGFCRVATADDSSTGLDTSSGSSSGTSSDSGTTG